MPYIWGGQREKILSKAIFENLPSTFYVESCNTCAQEQEFRRCSVSIKNVCDFVVYALAHFE